MKINFYSQAVKKKESFNIFFPKEITLKTKIIILLHGLGGNEDSYIEKSNILKWVENKNLLLVFPNGDRGFYNYHLNNINYQKYLLEEIIPRIKIYLDDDINKYYWISAGISMGGYGAFLLGKNSLFDEILSISGSLDFVSRTKDKLNDEKTKAEWLSFYGETINENNDLFKEINSYKNKKITIYCGEEDYLLKYNEKMHQKLKERNIAHDYIVKPGKHDKDFFYPQLKEYIDNIGD